jgi:hypothetical protein
MKLFNVRNVLSVAVAAKGIEIAGAGMGMGPYAGQADFDFELGRRHYWVHITEVEMDVADEALARRTYPNLVELMKITKWLKDAMTAHGAVINEGKLGCARSVFDFTIGGRYWVNVTEVEVEDDEDDEVVDLSRMAPAGNA